MKDLHLVCLGAMLAFMVINGITLILMPNWMAGLSFCCCAVGASGNFWESRKT